MARTGYIGRHYCSAVVRNEFYIGHTKSRSSFVTHVSILGMRDAPTFVIKGDTHAFMMGEGMGDAAAFIIKGDVLLATRVSVTFIIGDVH
jgi:hypothetical protein